MPHKPHLLVIMTDQQKATASALYGGPVRTPHLARIAAEGVLYERAYTPHPLCVPARVSLWTGRWPHAHGARTNETPMPRAETHFARVLHEHGYVLGHFGKNHCFTPEDFDACFDRVFEAGHGDAIGPGITSVRSAPPARPMMPDPGGLRRPVARVRDEPPQESATYQVTEQAIRFLEEHAPGAPGPPGPPGPPGEGRGGQPLCLWLSIPDPHTPLQVPQPYASLYPPQSIAVPPWRPHELDEKPERQRLFHDLLYYGDLTEEDVRLAASIYYGMIAFLDERVGAVLDTLERLGMHEDTAVVFTSDHGDYLGEHHLLGKSNAFYDCLTRVPLLLSYPRGVPARGERCADPVSLIDVLPTLLGLAGIPLPAGVQGRALPATPGAPVARGAAFSEYGAGGPAVTLEAARRLCPPGGPRAMPPLLREREGEGHGKMVFDGRWKYAYDSGPTGGEELYDLQEDPWELENLAHRPGHAEIVARLRLRLLDWMLETENARPVPLHYDVAALEGRP
jgi:arylsulfatase A-like enzyme